MIDDVFYVLYGMKKLSYGVWMVPTILDFFSIFIFNGHFLILHN